MVKIACQTIIFGNSPMQGNIKEIAETVKKIGYDGLETGAVHFKDNIEFFNDFFAKLDLKLAALHTGGNLHDKDKYESVVNGIKSTIDTAKKMSCPYVYLSSGWGVDRKHEDFLTEARHYREFGKMCNDAGVTFCYHNHDWELKNNGEGLKILMDNVPPELMKLVPDMAWLEFGGLSSLQFVKDNIDRLEAMHFKDFKFDENDKFHFTELGRGKVPLKEIYEYITGFDRDWWISAEEDRTELDPTEAARINYEFIAGLRK